MAQIIIYIDIAFISQKENVPIVDDTIIVNDDIWHTAVVAWR